MVEFGITFGFTFASWCGDDPRSALRGPWSGALAAMQLPAVPTSNGGVLARPSPARVFAPHLRQRGDQFFSRSTRSVISHYRL